jgi:hypothetical protein
LEFLQTGAETIDMQDQKVKRVFLLSLPAIMENGAAENNSRIIQNAGEFLAKEYSQEAGPSSQGIA